MLTGGLDVIGIYAVADSEHLKTLQGKLRQVSCYYDFNIIK